MDIISKRNQGTLDFRGNQNNVVEGQRPDIENKQTQQRTYVQSNKSQ